MSASQKPAKRIVVGIDGSPSSATALEWAVRQADLTDSEIEAVIAWEWPSSYGVGLIVPNDYNPADGAKAVADELLGAARRDHPNVTMRTVVIEGHAAPALVESSRGAELLVVGSRGHGEFAGMLLGSVSEHCVSNAHCPVLVFRDAEENHRPTQ